MSEVSQDVPLLLAVDEGVRSVIETHNDIVRPYNETALVPLPVLGEDRGSRGYNPDYFSLANPKSTVIPKSSCPAI